jgi:hypothetical protein
MTSFPFAESITLLKRVRAGSNADGNDVFTTEPRVIPGCVVWPTTSASLVGQGLRIELRTGGQATAVASINVLLPPGTDVNNQDALIWRGKTYEVEGDPDFFSSPFTGTDPGVVVRLTKVEG